MRYLNKIVFINSAGISYADISIDGNVHFIGTQGVGKSTTLRAILFFYNADKLKLGIEKGKRTFDEYYFPYGNSFIVYEVARESGPFCVLAFKSQGRVAFRFIEGPYKKENYINPENKAMSWEQIRGTFSGTNIYTRKIERYEEYRDILYGNNKGLNAEFRKYALIESRQYQNLPRTIQNVFLNSKLEAEFIKQTIIMSLNEEDVKIDLDQYELHLKDFEVQLDDISKWSNKNRSGEVVVRLIADAISKSYTEICFLEKEKSIVATQLITNHAFFEKALPGIIKQLENENEKLSAANKKVSEANQRFEDKKEKIVKEITLLTGKLNEAKQKSEGYERINIHQLIERVSKRSEWESRKEKLQKEQALLTARFTEITAKFDALIGQNKNHLNDFINLKNAEKNNSREVFYKSKEVIGLQCDELIAEIEKENTETKANAQELISIKTSNLHKLEIRKREVELERWYEREIEECKNSISEANRVIHAAGIEIAGSKKQLESIQKQWDFDLAKFDNEYNHTCARLEETILSAKKSIEQINTLINNRKNSLFDWLNENKPGWEKTIGKVINQEQVLFHTGLSPQNTTGGSTNFYGLEIDLKEISTSVKTIADYEKEVRKHEDQIKKSEATVRTLGEDRVKEQDRCKKKYQFQIKSLKDLIALKEYDSQKAISAKDQKTVQLDDNHRKAIEEKNAAIRSIKLEIEVAKEEKQAADEQLRVLTNQVRNQVEVKKKERDNKISKENTSLQETLNKLSEDIKSEDIQVQTRINDLHLQASKALEHAGADTMRLNAIDTEFVAIVEELQFIENNRQTVSEYGKDKRELFDLIDKFKSDKKIYENQLATERQRHEIAKGKLQELVIKLNHIIADLDASQRKIDEDILAFDHFSQTEVFSKLDPAALIVSESVRTTRRLKDLIDEINDKSFSVRDKLDDLRTSIQKFLSHFSLANIFGFKTNLIETNDFFLFAENLKEFLEEDKISEFEKRTNERFASLIFQIGKETTDLVSKEATIQKVISDINKDFEERNFAGVIKSINLRLSPSANKIVMLLSEIRKFNDEHALSLGKSNLFSGNETEQINKKAVGYLKNFASEIASSKLKEINLSDTFELQFKVVENDNDSGWVEKLTNVGSEGTDILVKAMINIMLLNVFKESASKRFKDFRLHCMMDEIGKLHPNNVKGILKFANDRNILLINSSPTSYNAVDYRHTYLLAKNNKNVTTVKKLITNN
ncbi:ATP-binding protein [Mucilaginibacter segetis]|uniref:ATP-binding protein n=1 Tax=Mucilaginibacter segetis TaxID=2793071 RepID=A0A934UN35_9SPHI|nr:ATP-binding protein [Mucilaginibacter segetis]MBK0380019.1 ATP-binding protein [Mucilaginibacter segetis]